MKILFVTGNQNKADYLARYLEYEVDHQKLDLEEIQSLDVKEVVEHKVKQAYAITKRPVLVEDVSLEFDALGGLPGPFIKWFVDKVPFQSICDMLGNNRGATARCVFGYYNGDVEHYFEGSLRGFISDKPRGEGGFGWDKFFIPEGYDITRAEMKEEDDQATYLRIKPFEQLKEFLDEEGRQ